MSAMRDPRFIPAARRGLREIEVPGTSKNKARAVGLIGLPTDCYLCGEPLTLETAEVEHVFPLSQGGLDLSENMRWSCVACNQIKGGFTLEELLNFARRLLQRFPLG